MLTMGKVESVQLFHKSKLFKVMKMIYYVVLFYIIEIEAVQDYSCQENIRQWLLNKNLALIRNKYDFSCDFIIKNSILKRPRWWSFLWYRR